MGVAMRKQAEGSISRCYKGNMCIKCLVIVQKDEFGLETHNPAYQSQGVFPSKQGGTGFLNSNKT